VCRGSILFGVLVFILLSYYKTRQVKNNLAASRYTSGGSGSANQQSKAPPQSNADRIRQLQRMMAMANQDPAAADGDGGDGEDGGAAGVGKGMGKAAGMMNMDAFKGMDMSELAKMAATLNRSSASNPRTSASSSAAAAAASSSSSSSPSRTWIAM
jgi:hypothetical protein